MNIKFVKWEPCLPAVLLMVLLSGMSMQTSAEDQPQGILPIPEYGGALSSRQYLSGDWGGKRTEWANDGLQLGLEYLHWSGSVTDGGQSDDIESGGNLTYKLKWDLMRADIMPGALIDVRAETRNGDNLNRHVGILTPASTASLPPVDYDELQRNADFTITNLTYTQFLSDKFGLQFGKMDLFETGDPNEFAAGRGRTQFQNYNFVFGPPTLLVPASTLGLVRARLAPGGLYTTNIVDAWPDPKMVKSMYKTLLSEFRYVHIWLDKVPQSPQRMTFVISASDRIIQDRQLYSQRGFRRTWYRMDDIVENMGTPLDDLPMLTDNYVPVERLISSLLLTEEGL